MFSWVDGIVKEDYKEYVAKVSAKNSMRLFWL